MSENRDTQFRGFAELVMRELLASYGYNEAGDIIARRAYDLVCHCFEQMNPIAPQACSTTEEMLEGIPDLTEWPKENTNG